MLDIHFIRDHIELVKQTVKNKNIKLDIDHLLLLDEKRCALVFEIDQLRQKRNEMADVLQDASKRTPHLIEEGKQIKETIRVKETEHILVEQEFRKLMCLSPTIPSLDTPIGSDSTENTEVMRWGSIPVFDFKAKDHIELGKLNEWIDVERGVKVAGFRGYFLKNGAALAQIKLMSHVLSKLAATGYVPMIPPTLVKESTLWGTGYFPFGMGDNYEIANVSEEVSGELMKEKLFLAGTAEVGIGAYYSDEILNESQLPLKFVGFSPCFRREVGSYGRDTRGLYRIHEFMKIEQFVICKNDYVESEKYHQELLHNSENILQELNIPYRVIQLCTGDMGAGKYKMFDIESWMPSRNSYGETHSCSNMGEWQARRLNLRYRKQNGDVEYVHTLNNTAIASPRILISLMELNQDKDGNIHLPRML